MRLAMWSGPRNLSTAMMYSFGARSDFDVMDEPFYAPYLAKTGHDHPMRDEILAHHETDPARVADACKQEGAPHIYMKHMPHHMVGDMPMDWTAGCVHVHLIRHPARVIASYTACALAARASAAPIPPPAPVIITELSLNFIACPPQITNWASVSSLVMSV